jgi:hypothetical protein
MLFTKIKESINNSKINCKQRKLEENEVENSARRDSGDSTGREVDF